MRISTLCNICYIVVSRKLLLYVFLQKLLHYLNKFTNRQRAVCQRELSFLLFTLPLVVNKVVQRNNRDRKNLFQWE